MAESNEDQNNLVQRLAEARVPYGTLALLLHLSRLRSDFIVGRSLAEKFPTEESWTRFTTDPITLEEFSLFAHYIRELRAHAKQITSPQDVEHMMAPHMDYVLECLSMTAEKLGIRPEDLITTLVTA